MKKKRLLKFLLVGGLMITSAAISLSSCTKDNEANEDLESLPTIQTIIYGDRDPSLGFICPYCGELVPSGGRHVHHFSPKNKEENTLPSNWAVLGLTWGSMTMTNDAGEVVPNNLGNRQHPFEVDYCETYWNLPPGGHVCGYAVEKIYHRHYVEYALSTNGYDGYTHNEWHVGGGTGED